MNFDLYGYLRPPPAKPAATQTRQTTQTTGRTTVRLDDVSPRTWLLGAVAGWAVLAWCSRSPAWAAGSCRCRTMPRCCNPCPPTRAPPERLGPYGQYAEISVRPLFSSDRRPQPFSLGGDEDTSNDFDYILSGVLLVPQVKLAMVQPSDGGDPERVKLGDAVEAAPAWRLVALNPRSAVFEGPGGQKTLELRVFDGNGGEPPSTATPATRRPMARRRRSACRRGRARPAPESPGGRARRRRTRPRDAGRQHRTADGSAAQAHRAATRAAARQQAARQADDADAQTDNP